MKFTFTTILAIIGTVVADRFEITTYCPLVGACNSIGVWISTYGSYGGIDANDGCRTYPGPPALSLLCMDWPNKRGHFFFERQNRRCMRQTFEQYLGSGGWWAIWDEVECNWREAPTPEQLEFLAKVNATVAADSSPVGRIPAPTYPPAAATVDKRGAAGSPAGARVWMGA